MEDKLVVGLSVEIKELQAKLKEAQNKLQGFGNEVEASLKPITLDLLETQLRALNDELKVTAIGSQRFKELGDQIVATEKKVTNAFGNISNVGTRGFNGLNNSINQITRELPAFGLSANIGFLAVSNNIPILIDEINRLKEANAGLVAQGKPTQSIFQAITGALFSYQTALSIGVTLLTLYGSKLIEFASDAFNAGGSLDTLAMKQEAYNEALESKALVNAVKEVALLSGELKMAKNGLIDKNEVIAKYNESLGVLTGKVTTLSEVERGLVDGTDAYVRAVIAREAANISAAKAAETLIQMQEKKAQVEQEALGQSTYLFKILEHQRKKGLISEQDYLNESAKILDLASIEGQRKAGMQGAKEYDALKQKYKDQLDVIMGFQNEAGKVLSGEGNNQFAKGSLGYLQEQLQKLEKNKLNLQVDSAELREANIQIDLLKMRIDEINNIGFLSKAETKGVDEFKSKLTQVEQAATKMDLALRNAQSGGSASMIQLNTTAELLSETVNSLTMAVGDSLASAFEVAFANGESFGLAFEKALKRLAARLLAVLAAAIALASVIGIISGGTGVIAGVTMPNFTKILGALSGGLFGGSSGSKVVSAVGAGSSMAQLQLVVRGEDLVSVVNNTQSRLDRIK